MSRPITWAIRLTLPSGRQVFWRARGLEGGPIMTYRSQAAAEHGAQLLRGMVGVQSVAVIERSHGRQEVG